MFHINQDQNWERMVILELNREHESTCRYYRVQLKPIAIQLFDSESLWGQYEQLTNSISISRKLVRDFDWQFVLGVFRHEMAHQYVAEKLIASTKHTSHGESFQEACIRLGVPEPFRRAGLNFQNQSPDWREHSINDVSEKLLDKTKKLLALANSSNVYEAQSAMEKVREIYARHNLNDYQRDNGDEFTHLIISLQKKKMAAWEKRALSILADHFFVKTIVLTQFDQKKLDTFCAIELIGKRENVLMAEYVYHFLMQQMELALKDAVKNQGLSGSQKRIFRVGVMDGFNTKLEFSRQASKKNRGNERAAHANSCATSAGADARENTLSVIDQALIKFETDALINQYLKCVYPRLTFGHTISCDTNTSAYSSGQTAGKNINLKKPITTSPPKFGGLLN